MPLPHLKVLEKIFVINCKNFQIAAQHWLTMCRSEDHQPLHLHQTVLENEIPCDKQKDNERHLVCKSTHNHLPTIYEANPAISEDDSSPSQLGGTIRIIINATRNIFMSYRYSNLLTFLLVLGNVTMLLSRFGSDEDISQFLFNREDSCKKVQGVEDDIRRLHQTLSALDNIRREGEIFDIDFLQNNHSFADLDMEVSEVKDLQQRVKVLSRNADNLKIQVQDWSRREIEKKYGDGIHMVEIELAFPGKSDGPDKFVIELAGVNQMPHSVHVFLDMVSVGLLDGCSFILKTLHILKAAPLPHDGSSAAAKARSFTKQGLESVAFKEYSESYPPQNYTVGFAANGGPGFYINTKDNTEIDAGDPCFGKIVSGFDAVRRMEDSPTINGMWLKERIGIKHARIL